MHETITSARPASFWVVAIAALLWNLIGVAMLWLQVNLPPDALAAMPPEQRAVYEATPGWLNGAFALAVFGGVLGALGLLLRKRWAVAAFAISLLGLLLQIGGAYAVTPAWSAYGPAGLAMPALLLAIAIALLLYARRAASRGWLG